jgi:hypothetical protein
MGAKKYCSRLGGANKVSVNFDTGRAQFRYQRVQKRRTKNVSRLFRSSVFAALLWIGRRVLSAAPAG